MHQIIILVLGIFISLSYVYNEHLDIMPLHGQAMRFQGEDSLVDCLIQVENLIIKAILKSLGLSTHKDACAFLDRVKDNVYSSQNSS